MTLNFRTIFWSTTGIILVALIIWSFLPRPVPADFATVERADMTVTVRDEGYTRVRDVYIVSAPVGGRLLRVDSEAGDTVEAGQVLANILPSDPAFLDARSQGEAEAALRASIAALGFAQADRQRAEAEAEQAQTELDRYQRLAQSGTVSQAALDRVRTDWRRAQAALASANANVRMREADRDAVEARLMEPDGNLAAEGIVAVSSPIDGRVLRVRQESEAVVGPGTPLVELGNPRDLEIVAELLSTDAVQVREGASAQIKAWGGEPLPATVRRVEPFGFLKISALGVEEQRVNVILDLTAPDNEWVGLGHGFRVEPEIEVWRGDDVLTAPVAALFRHEGGWAAFQVEGDRAQLVEIEIGQTNGVQAEILSGLAEDDTLVLYPSDRIDDGVMVEARGG